MAQAIKTQKDFQFTMERQTAWTTSAGSAIDTSPILLLTEDMPITIEPLVHNIPVARGIRGNHEKDNWNSVTEVIPTASMTVWATPSGLQNILPAMFQNVTEWTAGSNVFDIWTVPTCSGTYGQFPNPKSDNLGYYYTLTRRACQASSSEVIENAICTNMTFKIDETDDLAQLTIDTEWIGQFYQRAQDPTGTVIDATLGNAYTAGNIATTSAVTWGAFDLSSDFVSAEISVTNGAKYVNDLSTGPVVFPMWEVTGSFTVAAGDNTEAMKVLAETSSAEDARTLQIGFGDGTVSSTGELNITCFTYLDSFEEDFSEGETVTFNFRGVFGALATSEYPMRLEFFES